MCVIYFPPLPTALQGGSELPQILSCGDLQALCKQSGTESRITPLSCYQHFTNVEAAGHRGEVTYPGSRSELVPELGMNPRAPDSHMPHFDCFAILCALEIRLRQALSTTCSENEEDSSKGNASQSMLVLKALVGACE